MARPLAAGSPDMSGGSPSAGLILILGLLAAFGPFSLDMYLSAFGDMQADLGTSAAGVAATLSVFLFGLAADQLAYGPISDRFGRRAPLLAGIALFTVASMACLVTRDIGSFLVWRGLQAMGGCAGIVLGRAVIRDLYDQRGVAMAFSTLSMIGMAAPIMAPSLGVALVSDLGWRAVFGVLVGLGALCFVLVGFGLPETLPAHRRQAGLTPASAARAMASLLRRSRFVLPAMMMGSASGALFSFITGSSLTLIGGFGVSRTCYAAIFSAVVLAMIAGGQINRFALRRYTPSAILGLVMDLQGALAVALIFSGHGLVPMVGVLIGLVATLGFILPNSATLAMLVATENVGSASSLLGVLQFGAGFVASTLVAATQNGTPLPMLLTIAGCAAVGRLAWALCPKSEPSPRQR